MKKIYLLIFSLTSIFASCTDDTDFSTQEADCEVIEIQNNNKIVTLEKDTAWYLSENGEKQFYCDKFKIYAFFNVLRDITLQGLSKADKNSDFKYIITVKTKSGRTTKTIKFEPISNTPQMIASCNGGKCYVVAIPGLKESPTASMSAEKDYWKNLSLLEILPENISALKIINYIDSTESFAIHTQGNNFEVKNCKNEIIEIEQTNIRQYLGSISGTYRAKEYLQKLDLPEKSKIYDFEITSKLGITTKISFYKKLDSNGKPDFNLMYFSDEKAFGTAKYFDFEKILIDLKRLK
ncbi:MAG: hypothetical protein IKQ46_05875 [Bacteroidales bacterium]|nr:hypothetical protein [Bacteroidales bacterium]